MSPRPALLTASELAASLGVTRRWVYQQVEEHDLPAYRLGRSLRFDVEAVDTWLEARRVGSWHTGGNCANPISRVSL